MSPAVLGVVQTSVCVHGLDRFVVVHGVGVVSQPQLSQLLCQKALSALADLPSLSLPEASLEPIPFRPTVVATVFLGEPA